MAGIEIFSDMHIGGKINSDKQGYMLGTMSSLPAAAPKYNQIIVLYTGATTADYEHNRFYRCDGTQWLLVDVGSGGQGQMPYADIDRVKPYLYDISYTGLDYAYAYDRYKTDEDVPTVGACSAVREGDLLGRNYDWLYNEQAEFIVNVPPVGGRHGTIGMASGPAGLTDAFVQSGEYSDDYRFVPFCLVDGINDAGLTMETNVVPMQGDGETATPTDEVLVDLCAPMLVRYVLDHFATVDSAVSWLKAHARIYYPKMLHDIGYEAHWMIADAMTTKVLEIHDGALVDVESEISTNFSLSGVTLNADGSVYTPATQTATETAHTTNLIEENGQGLERWNVLASGKASAESPELMRELMSSLNYTRMYSTASEPSDPFWYTEYVGGTLTVDSAPADFSAIVASEGVLYTNRDRSKTGAEATWQSMHSVVYDIAHLKAYVTSQEEDIAYERTVDVGATDYGELANKPKINSVTLEGDKSSQDLGIVTNLTQAEYDALPSSKFTDGKLYCIYDNATLGDGDSLDTATWGNIAGDIANQTDLQDALDAKAPQTAVDACELKGKLTINGVEYDVQLGTEADIQAGKITFVLE